MGATNHTTNYNLSQFEPTDKPAWLQDYNGDMTKIDAGINTAQLAADAAQLTANTADGKADSANSAITNTVTPAITALQTASTNQGGAINTINSLIGNGTPTTTDQTIIGAINEINAEVGQISSDLAWKVAGTLDSNTTSINTPATYEELLLILSDNSGAIGTSIHIPKLNVTATGRTYRSGYYADASHYGALDVHVSSSAIDSLTVKLNGSLDASARCAVYYR